MVFKEKGGAAKPPCVIIRDTRIRYVVWVLELARERVRNAVVSTHTYRYALASPTTRAPHIFCFFFFRRTRVGIRAPNKVLARDDESDRVEKGPMMMMMLCCNFHVYVRLIVHSRNIMMGNYLEIIIAVSDDDYEFSLCWCAVGGGKPTE